VRWNAYTHTNGYTYCNAHTYRNGYAYRNGYVYCDRYTHGDSNSDATDYSIPQTSPDAGAATVIDTRNDCVPRAFRSRHATLLPDANLQLQIVLCTLPKPAMDITERI